MAAPTENLTDKTGRKADEGKGDEVFAEELAIWAIVGVTALLVAALIWRGDGTPRIESSIKARTRRGYIRQLSEFI